MASQRVLVHEDDLGMCHGTNLAFAELTSVGLLDGGSIMMVGPWFAEVAEMAAADPHLDLGVHLTLNSEARRYKWRPLTRPGRAAGLSDDDGFLWPTVDELRAHCAPEAAEAEMRAQLDLALQLGLDITHADSHLFAALAPEFRESYLRIGTDYRIPVLLSEQFDATPLPRQLGTLDAPPYQDLVAQARTLGFPVFDALLGTVWDRTESAWDSAQSIFERVGEGLTYVALHPSVPGEIEAIEPHIAHIRIGEYRIFSDPEFLGWLDTLEYERVGWREMRTALRERLDG